MTPIAARLSHTIVILSIFVAMCKAERIATVSSSVEELTSGPGSVSLTSGPWSDAGMWMPIPLPRGEIEASVKMVACFLTASGSGQRSWRKVDSRG